MLYHRGKPRIVHSNRLYVERYLSKPNHRLWSEDVNNYYYEQKNNTWKQRIVSIFGGANE